MKKLWQKIKRAYVFRPSSVLIPSGTVLFLTLAAVVFSIMRPHPNPFLVNCKPTSLQLVGAEACETDQPFSAVRLVAEDWAQGSEYSISKPDPYRMILKGKKDSFEIIGGTFQSEDEVTYSAKGPTTIVSHHVLDWKERAKASVEDAGIR